MMLVIEMLSFNASTIDREALSKITNPYQILPGGRSSFQAKDVATFIEGKNENVLIHSSYITRPFKEDISNVTRINLRNYAELAKRIGTKDILVHMPSNVLEYEEYAFGINAIIEYVIKNGCVCHLETNPLSRELQTFLEMNRENAVSVYTSYTDSLLEIIPTKYRDYFYVCVDTAHLFANGFDGLSMIKYIDKYKHKVKYIHFNGNMNSMFTKDKHVPMYRLDNKIDNVDKLTSFCSSLKKILIVEDSTEKGSYDDWKAFCDKYKIRLVAFNDVYSI